MSRKKASESKLRKILIIDDNLFILNLVKTILSKSGFTIETCQNGAESFDRICKENPDLIILDRKLDGINGNEILERIKNNELTEKIPVTMISSDNHYKQILQSISLGAEDYIVKPFKAGTLISKVTRILENGQKTEDDYFFVS